MLKECLQALINAILSYVVDVNQAGLVIGDIYIEAGTIVLSNGETETTVSFKAPFALYPVLNVTAIDNPLLENNYTVREKTTSGFQITDIKSTPVRFDYIAIGRKSS